MNFTQKYLSSQLLKRQKIEQDNLFSTCALVKGKIYAFTAFKRLPIVGDLHTGKFILLEDSKDYDPLFAADNMISDKDNIFVLELNGNRVLKYNINDNIYQYFDIGCHQKEWGNYAAFAKYEEYLYIIPRYKNELIKFEIKSGTVQKNTKFYPEENIIKANINKEKDSVYFWYGCQCGNVIWLFKKHSNLIIEYNMQNEIWKEHKLSIVIKECVHAIQYNEILYILSSEGKIFCWDIINESIKILADCSERDVSNNTFSRIALTDKNIFLLPALGKEIFCLDFYTGKTEKYQSYPESFKYCGPEYWSKYLGYCEDKNNYYFAMRSTNFILTINKRNGKAKWIRPEEPSFEEYEKKYIEYNKSMLFEVDCRLENMFRYLQKDSKDKYENHLFIGKQIWEQMKKLDRTLKRREW